MLSEGSTNFQNNQFLFTNFDPCQRAWLEISSKAIEVNTRKLKSLVGPECVLMAVVKADGYGHGAETVAKAALSGGAGSLGVATIQEGIELRQAGLNCSILLLGNLLNVNELGACLHWDLVPTLSSVREALICQNIASDSGKKFPVHMKVDTGMSRLGCDLNEALNLYRTIDCFENLKLDGIYSHLAMADSDDEESVITTLQRQRFESFRSSLSCSEKSLSFHLANSAGTLRNKNLHYDMVRVGLAIYGHNPLTSLSRDLGLKHAMSVKARVTLLRTVPEGTGVGYGHRFITKRKTRLAVVGIGYADGISRVLSGKIFALYKGNYLPQVGAIAMDQLVLDITDTQGIKAGNIVTLLGQDGSKSIDARQWSDLSGSIPWEVLCGFKHRLPRVVV